MSKIAVLMPVHNGEKYLKEAIESVLVQTYRDFRFYIYDDGSRDGSMKIVESYLKSDDRMFLLSQIGGNIGISASINYLISIVFSRTKYINVVDQDDISHPNKLEYTYNFMEQNPDYGLVGSKYSIIDEQSNVIQKLDWMLTEDKEIRENFFFQNWFGHGSILFRKSVLDKVGYYDSLFDQAQDYELTMRVMEVSKVANLSEHLWFWRRHEGNEGKINLQLQLVKMATYKRYCERMGVKFNPENFYKNKATAPWGNV